jgi:heme/copper-type cytochrome/quinol oxidase subunit 2
MEAMSDMSITTLVVVGIIVLAVLGAAGYIALRYVFGREQTHGNRPSGERTRRDDRKRGRLH